MAAVGNGSQPFRRAALRQAQGDLPLPPPAGDMSDEAVGRGPRARRFSGNERNQANGTTRAVPERAAFRTVRGTVPTTGNNLHRKHVIAVVGNGFQPFRRAALRQAQGDLPLHPPAGDTSNDVVGRGPRTRRFSGNERNQANATTRAVPERAAFRTVRGTVPTSGNSPYNGTVPTSQACDGGCRERFPTVPEGSPSTSSG